MRTALAALLLSLGSLVGCSSDDATSSPSGESGAAGAAAGQGGSVSGSSGQSGAAGSAGSGGQGLAGQGVSGSSGQAGAAGAGGTTPGAGGAGAGGAAGTGEGGAAAGTSGGSGQGGAGSGQAGSGEAGGGQAGGGGAGGSGQAGGGQAGGGQAGGGMAGGAGEGGAGQGGSAGAANGGLAEVLSAELFDEMFPHRGDPACQGSLFTHAALIEAAKAFPTFAAQGTLDDRKRELAAFFANAGHETTGGWSTAPGGPQAWGLCFREELGCGGGACTGYCAASEQYPCAPGKTYHGRGPLQLSYNYNYGQAGDALGLPLLATPELVASDGVVSFQTALWFWMTAQAPKPSCHDVMTGQWSPTADDLAANRKPGFGMTVNIINGGLECSQPTPDKVQDRLDYYARFTTLLGVAPGDNLSCDTMQHY